MGETTATERPIVLEAKRITKRFPGVVANDQVSLQLYKGETLALLGENGAGKSTLMNILYGMYQQDEGDIFVNGTPVRVTSPHEAIDLGIGMVHQHFQLVPVMTVAENIMLGQEVTNGALLDTARASTHIRTISQQYGLAVDPDALVADLPVGAQQRVEIIKALYRNADILILDEPTAVLTPQEADDLFKVMRALADEGKSIIFITHKLREVLAYADRIVVLRSGKVVGETTPERANEESLASMMVGRSVVLQVEKSPPTPGKVVLNVNQITVISDRDQPAVADLSLQVRAGEVVGIAGVQGNGQTELVQAITGLRSIASGTITISGKMLKDATPREVAEMGTAHVPEDRLREGVVKHYPLTDNAVLEIYYLPPFAQTITTAVRELFAKVNAKPVGDAIERGILRVVRSGQAVLNHTRALIAEFDVRTPGPHVHASKLSGGNQQKLIIAREFTRPIKLLVAAQPTRGVDVGSIEFIHQQIIRKRDEGCAVLLVSAELDEILALADRIAVMYHGHIVQTVNARDVTREQLGIWMAGGSGTPTPPPVVPQPVPDVTL